MPLVVKRGAYFFVVRNPLIKQRKAVTKLLSTFSAKMTTYLVTM